MSWYGGYAPYVSVAKQQQDALKKIRKLRKSGKKISPIETAGRRISHTFWGKAWCKHLETYSDYDNRLPRGRRYVRAGAVIDLKMKAGQVTALVDGSSLYKVKIKVGAIDPKRWDQFKKDCGGKIESLIELLQGKLNQGVMEKVCDPKTGLFPSLKELKMTCSCLDWAAFCKHLAATLYGVAARLDDAPEMLFKLRGVDPSELIAEAVTFDTGQSKTSRKKVLADDQLSSIFGIDLSSGQDDVAMVKPKQKAHKKGVKKTKTNKTNKTKKKTTRRKTKTSSARKTRPKKRKTSSG